VEKVPFSSEAAMARRKPRRRPLLRRYLIAVAVSLLVLLGATFVWPTPYAYAQVAIGDSFYNVRVHRLSGVTEIGRTWGWEKIDGLARAATPLAELPAEQLAQLAGTPRIEWGSLQYDLHNRTPWTVWELTAELTVRNRFGTVLRTRTYTLRNSTSSVRCSPGATATFFARLGFNLESGQTWGARVLCARGTP
jgi:hypothetical protein